MTKIHVQKRLKSAEDNMKVISRKLCLQKNLVLPLMTLTVGAKDESKTEGIVINAWNANKEEVSWFEPEISWSICGKYLMLLKWLQIFILPTSKNTLNLG